MDIENSNGNTVSGNSGDVIFNEITPATKDINSLYKTYNSDKGIEIDRLQSVYTTLLESKDSIIAEKSALIEELKGVISDLREVKKKLTDLLGK